MPEGPVIIDTGPIVALLWADEPHHAWAANQIKTLPAPLLTCEPVLAESFHLMRRAPGGAKRLFQFLDRSLIKVEFNLMDERDVLASLTHKYADLPMSLADACLVRMAELHSGSTVFTLDSHFRVYRKNRRQLIPLIIPDS